MAFYSSSVRLSHRAASYPYLQEWQKRGVNFANEVKFVGKNSIILPKDLPITPAHFPRLTRDILRLEAATRQSAGTFVHAHPQWVAVGMRVATHVYANHPHFMSFRPPVERRAEQVRKQVSEAFARGKRDMDPEIRPHVISASYAFTSSLAVADSALFHGLRLNQRPDVFPIGLQMVEHALLAHGMSSNEAKQASKELANLVWEKCQKVVAGEFYVIAPPSLDVVYDAKAWGVPTGSDVRSILDRPSACPRFHHGHAVRLLMCRETTDPSYGMRVYQANDRAVVDALAKDVTDPRSYPEYVALLSEADTTSVEIADQRKRQEISEILSSFMKTWVL